MANVLKVTTPGAGYDNNSIKNAPFNNRGEEIQIQNPVVPDKVTRGDNRTDMEQQQGGELKFQYESNFGAFLQAVKNSPDVLKALTNLLFLNAEAAGLPESAESYQKLLEQFLEQSKFSEEELVPFIKEQAGSATRFGGGLFDVLRQVMNETNSVDLKSGILNFMKNYNDMSSGPHLLTTVKNLLEEMRTYMFRQSGENLEALAQKLNFSAPAGQTGANAAVLREDIMPFLGRYISQTRDMGQLRNHISTLTGVIARYENGSFEQVLASFKRLLGYPEVRQKLPGVNGESFRQYLEGMDYEREAGKTEFSSRFQELISQGAKGEAGTDNRQVFLNFIRSMVMNESVYMPLIHMAFPLNYEGKQMMSELWIDPDDRDSQSGEPKDRTQKILLRFEIAKLGQIDMIILSHNHQVSMRLRYPEEMMDMEAGIRSRLDAIAGKYGYAVQELQMEVGKRPYAVTDVFPKIYERKNSVNVRV